MSELVSTMVGGGIALVASLGSTLFAQSRVSVTARSTRAHQAAEQLADDLVELRELPPEPERQSDETKAAWQEQRTKLLTRIESQSLRLPPPDLRARIALAVEAMSDPETLYQFERLSEVWVRRELCRDGQECIGAFLRDEKSLPVPTPTAKKVHKSLADTNAELEWQWAAQQESEKAERERRRKSPAASD
jgi:hypothetical protein